MPSVSSRQHRFMEMVAHDPAAAKRVGVPQSVGEEFSQADKGRKFSTKAVSNALRKRKPNPKSEGKDELPFEGNATGGTGVAV